MTNIRHNPVRHVGSGTIALALLALALFTLPLVSVRAADSNPPPFDFSDEFYIQNGIDPAAILKRAGNPDRNPLDWTIDDTNTDLNRRNIRLLQTTGGFNNSGGLIYYSIMGMVMPSTFTNDAAGQQAKEIANRFRAFIFPKRQPDGSVKLDPGLGNRRQDNVFDTRNGYFSNNPLGLWILAFVAYTPQAFTPEGQRVLAPIAAANGTDLDGTPILTSASLIDNLVSQGLAQILTRPLDGSQGFPWVI